MTVLRWTMLWGLALPIYLLSMALNFSGRLPDKWYYAVRIVADLFLVATEVLDVIRTGEGLSPWVGLWLAILGLDYLAWRRHKDDDDDWGDRLKSWAKSKIPKPTIVQPRPLAAPT